MEHERFLLVSVMSSLSLGVLDSMSLGSAYTCPFNNSGNLWPLDFDLPENCSSEALLTLAPGAMLAHSVSLLLGCIIARSTPAGK